MARHDFTPAWLSFPTEPSSTKSYDRSLETPPERLDYQGHVSLRRHNSSDGTEAVSGLTGGGWKLRTSSEGSSSSSSSSARPDALRCKNRGVQDGRHADKRKKFGAEDFPSLNPDAGRELNQNKAVAAGVWEHPPNPQSRSSKMMVIRRVPREDLSSSSSSSSSAQQQVPARNGTGPLTHKASVTKLAALPVKASRSSSSSPVDQAGPPRMMMRLSRMRSDKKSHFLKALKEPVGEEDLHLHFLKALKQEPVGEEDLHLHCKDQDVFQLQNNNHLNQLSGGGGNCNGYEGRAPQENGNTSALRQQEVLLSSSLEAEHRLLREMGWQEESENDETCAPLTEDEMREFQAISEQLQRSSLRRNVQLKSVLAGDDAPLTRPATEETSSSSDTSDDEA